MERELVTEENGQRCTETHEVEVIASVRVGRLAH
jgi:hypothetical protein